MRYAGVVVLLALLVSGCTQPEPGSPSTTNAERTSESLPSGSPSKTGEAREPAVPPSSTATRMPASRPADPRWVFFTEDRTRFRSRWYVGAHRVMVPFGCTSAPYYSPDPRCPDGQGFHHGVDIAIPCGTPLRAGVGGEVVDGSALGSAYGDHPLLLRNSRLGMDILVAHTRRWAVGLGDVVRPGQRLAWVSDAGAPDGCHLHLEVRALGGRLDSARDPMPILEPEAR